MKIWNVCGSLDAIVEGLSGVYQGRVVEENSNVQIGIKNKIPILKSIFYFTLNSTDQIHKIQCMIYPYKIRAATERLTNLFRLFPVVVVTGARQVGKSTFVTKVLGEACEHVVFDPIIDVQNAREDPELFLRNQRTPVILDEIQYAPQLVPALKRRVDQERVPGQYMITGSQQWEVMKQLAESLSGRAVFVDLEAFTLQELNETADERSWLAMWLDPSLSSHSKVAGVRSRNVPVYEQLWRGWFPEVQFLDLSVIPDFYGGYLRTYVDRDARQLAQVEDWHTFGRFYRLAGALSAQQINYSQFGRDIGIHPETAKRWLAVMTATFQWYEVPAYSGNTIKRISSKPKGYLADTGLICFCLAISTPKALSSHPNWGAIFETAIASEVRKYASLLSPPPRCYHWNTHAGAEVDILLERDGIFFPIEIKANSYPKKKGIRGLRAFRESYPQLEIADGLIIAPTDVAYQLTEHDWVVPWDGFC